MTVATLVYASGCSRPEKLEFIPDVALVNSLGEELDEDFPGLAEELQVQINKQLEERCGEPLKPKMLGVDKDAMAKDEKFRHESHLQHGAAVYQRRCAACHGVTGDGNGPMAKYMDPKPRDYRGGRDKDGNPTRPSIFKFTTTPFGSKPRRSDLVSTVRRGVAGTSMPSFDRLSETEVQAVVDYVLVLTHRGELERILHEVALEVDEDNQKLDLEFVQEGIDDILDQWKEAESQLVQPASQMPTFSPETVAKGQKIFLTRECNKCHGNDGRGGSVGDVEVGFDDWGHKGAAADLTSGMFRGGSRPIDIYRRIYSGINGTPMPKFGDSFAENPDDVWHLVHFIADTGERRRRGELPSDTPPAPPIASGQTADAPADDTPAEPEVGADAEDSESAGSADASAPAEETDESNEETTSEESASSGAGEGEEAAAETANEDATSEAEAEAESAPAKESAPEAGGSSAEG